MARTIKSRCCVAEQRAGSASACRTPSPAVSVGLCNDVRTESSTPTTILGAVVSRRHTGGPQGRNPYWRKRICLWVRASVTPSGRYRGGLLGAPYRGPAPDEILRYEVVLVPRLHSSARRVCGPRTVMDFHRRREPLN